MRKKNPDPFLNMILFFGTFGLALISIAEVTKEIKDTFWLMIFIFSYGATNYMIMNLCFSNMENTTRKRPTKKKKSNTYLKSTQKPTGIVRFKQ